VFFPKEKLTEGANTVSLKFKNTYVNNSAGLHWFEDPANQKVYIFSHLEPFFCHRVFPCFDQPDVKAPLKLTMHCPLTEWVAIGNGTLKEKHDFETEEAQKFISDNSLEDLVGMESGSIHFFNETPAQSSYIYALMAGEYHCFENDDPEAQVPMRIFVRETLKQHVNHKEMFRVVKEGIKFYEDFFGYPYPWGKYDQIYCPEFRISAMENIGAITFTELFVSDPKEMTTLFRTRIYYVVLHELSHMWFGNLVTMKWWEDLWLKESFADFMSALCINTVDALSNFECREGIFLSFSTMAMDFDETPATHPILSNVKNTEDATNVFDHISYRKGARFINFLVGYHFL
jgi:aminopeptidase N